SGSGCWGIILDDGGYPVNSFFRHLTVRRNLVKNQAFRAIGISEAVNAIIENNIITGPATTGGSAAAISAPRGAHRNGAQVDDTMTGATIRNNTIYFTSAAVSPIAIIADVNEGTGYTYANNAILFGGSGGTCLSMALPPASLTYDNYQLCN